MRRRSRAIHTSLVRKLTVDGPALISRVLDCFSLALFDELWGPSVECWLAMKEIEVDNAPEGMQSIPLVFRCVISLRGVLKTMSLLYQLPRGRILSEYKHRPLGSSQIPFYLPETACKAERSISGLSCYREIAATG